MLFLLICQVNSSRGKAPEDVTVIKWWGEWICTDGSDGELCVGGMRIRYSLEGWGMEVESRSGVVFCIRG